MQRQVDAPQVLTLQVNHQVLGLQQNHGVLVLARSHLTRLQLRHYQLVVRVKREQSVAMVVPSLHFQIKDVRGGSLGCFVYMETVFVLLGPDLNESLVGVGLSYKTLSLCNHSLINHAHFSYLRLVLL